MTINAIDRFDAAPMPVRSAGMTGLRDFPTHACPPSASSCPSCVDCSTDCSNCELCRYNECPTCAAPDLTPRTAQMLVVAARRLATQLAQTPRRAPLADRTAGLAIELADGLERGRRPWPTTMAEQLCLYVVISSARELACDIGEIYTATLPISDYDYDFDRLCDTLMPDDSHLALVDAVALGSTAQSRFDFGALSDALTPSALANLFRPLAAFPDAV